MTVSPVIFVPEELRIVTDSAICFPSEVLRQQKYAGNNLNQLTKIANSGTVNVIDLSGVKAEYAKITELLNEILERGRWR